MIVVFAISNRYAVTVHFWPFIDGFELPLYLVGLVLGLGGFAIGSSVAWSSAGSARRRARSAEREVRGLKETVDTLQQSVSLQEGSLHDERLRNRNLGDGATVANR